MAELDFDQILTDMLGAAKGVLKKQWADAKPFAEQSFKDLAANLVLIEKLKLQGKITEEQAKHYLSIYKNSVKIVLLTIEGIGLLTAQNAINAALGVVKKAVNTALGFALIV